MNKELFVSFATALLAAGALMTGAAMRATQLPAGLRSVEADSVAPLKGEGLRKQITIEREVVPQIQSAKRMPIFPQLLAPKVVTHPLKPSAPQALTSLPARFAPLEPAPSAQAIATVPERGYATVAYGPLNDVTLGAGYRLYNEARRSLDLWTLLTREAYKARLSPNDGAKSRWDRLDFTFGVNRRWRYDVGTLTWQSSLHLSHFSCPWLPKLNPGADDYGSQTTLRTMTTVGWESHLDPETRYHLRANVGMFRFLHRLTPQIEGPTGPIVIPADGPRRVRQMTWGLQAGLARGWTPRSTLAMDFDAQFLMFTHYTDGARLLVDPGLLLTGRKPSDSFLCADIALNPYYAYRDSTLTAHVGLRAAAVIHGHNSVRLTPDFSLTLEPYPAFALTLAATGGEHLNSLAALSNDTPYLSPLGGYRTSAVPLDASAALRFGPVHGCSLTAFGGYAMADNWLMPVDGYYGMMLMTAQRLRAWHGGATLSLQFQPLMALEATYHRTFGSGAQNVYFPWRDRARQTAEITLRLQPWRSLNVSLDYRMRLDRSGLQIEHHATTSDHASSAWGETTMAPFDLGNIHDLRLGASYAITPRCSAYVDIDNLLARRWRLLYGVPSRRLHGKIGLSFKF